MDCHDYLPDTSIIFNRAFFVRLARIRRRATEPSLDLLKADGVLRPWLCGKRCLAASRDDAGAAAAGAASVEHPNRRQRNIAREPELPQAQVPRVPFRPPKELSERRTGTGKVKRLDDELDTPAATRWNEPAATGPFAVRV